MDQPNVHSANWVLFRTVCKLSDCTILISVSRIGTFPVYVNQYSQVILAIRIENTGLQKAVVDFRIVTNPFVATR